MTESAGSGRPKSKVWGRIPFVGPTLVKLREPENKVLEAFVGLGAIGFVLVLGAATVTLGPGNGWLGPVGATFLSIGTAGFMSTVAARETSTESYRKEANLRRRDELYGPLYTELKQLKDWIGAAEACVQPFPQWIQIEGMKHPDGQMFIPGFACPSLAQWPTFRADHRIDQFSSDARLMLDNLIDRANSYNQAVLDTRQPCRTILERVLEQKVGAVTRTEDFKQWVDAQKKANPQTFPQEMYTLSDNVEPKLQKYQAIASWQSASTEQNPIHRAWAGSLVDTMNVRRPVTSGWLLGQAPDRAAESVINESKRSNPAATGPEEWYTDLFTDTCAKLRDTPEYVRFRASVKALKAAVDAPVDRLADRLTYIRDRYEGGPPLV